MVRALKAFSQFTRIMLWLEVGSMQIYGSFLCENPFSEKKRSARHVDDTYAHLTLSKEHNQVRASRNTTSGDVLFLANNHYLNE